MNNITELVFILDRSGSMAGLEADTIGGFNSMIERQKKESGRAYVTTVLFDSHWQILHDRLPLEKLRPMTERDYCVQGCTALLDAVGSTVRHIAHIHRYSREADRPQRTVVVITTDGMENASRQYSYDQVKQLVEKEKTKYGWEFIFLGANIDAAETAGRFGIERDHAADFISDAQGTAVNYDTLSKTISTLRSCSAPLSADWKRDIEKDVKNRKS